jgi:transposase
VLGVYPDEIEASGSGLVSSGFYLQRHKIENFFQWIKIYKRVSTRYEKLALTFLNFILVAAVFDWLKSF